MMDEDERKLEVSIMENSIYFGVCLGIIITSVVDSLIYGFTALGVAKITVFVSLLTLFYLRLRKLCRMKEVFKKGRFFRYLL